MQASILDLRRRMPGILRAMERQEPVTILHRGKKKGVLVPAGAAALPAGAVRRHPAFGMWKDRKDLADVRGHVRSLRRGRRHAV
jgi:antitoxin (DNA-binding transcriptional repressor) of toxin-antitoxin stability system